MSDFITNLKVAIRERHFEQLRGLDLVVDPLEGPSLNSTYNDLVEWTKHSQMQIAAGKADRVYGGQIGSPINFNNAFLAFLESAAMYLRDSSKIVQAVYLFNSGGNKEDALSLFESSTDEINKVADMWGMHFIQVCDFVTRHPDGHRYLVGPFCGIFFPKDFSGNNPFIGVAFKGTSVTREIINDLSAMITIHASGRLWGSQVSEGFYYPIFSTYNKDYSHVPFTMIRQAVQEVATKGKTTAVTHVTGHSLGGAYSTLCYAQLCIEGFGTSKATLGDLYTFGSPRVGRGDFARLLKAAVTPPASNGSTWRIVNNKDYIPQIPVSLFWTRDPFTHIDTGYKIFPDKRPVELPSEIGTHPHFRLPTAISPHFTSAYYKSLTYATTLEPPTHTVVSRERYPLAVSTYSNAIDTSLPLDDTGSAIIIVESIEDLTVGTIRFHNFFAEFTAYGVVQAKLNNYPRPAKLRDNPWLQYNKSVSFKTLYATENQVIFSKDNDTTLKIVFIVGGAQLAIAYVSSALGDIGEVALTRGNCVWTFYENEEADASIVDIADKIFSIPDEDPGILDKASGIPNGASA